MERKIRREIKENVGEVDGHVKGKRFVRVMLAPNGRRDDPSSTGPAVQHQYGPHGSGNRGY